MSCCALVLGLSSSQAPAQPCAPAWGGTYAPLGMNSPVNALAVVEQAGRPALIAAGRFTQAGGVAAAKIASWDGNDWSPLGTGFGGVAPSVHALAVAAPSLGGLVFVGGDFTRVDDIEANRVALWDGADWLALGEGVDGPVFALTVFNDGTGPALFAAGSFTAAGGAPASRIAKWDGFDWSVLGAGVNGRVLALAVYDDGTGRALYVAGDFTTAGVGSANRIARWDGQSWSGVGAGFNNSVFALSVFTEGLGAGPSLYAGGNFTVVNGVSVSRIARWDGVAWHALGSGVSNTVRALAAFDDGTLAGAALYVGGSFTSAGGQSVNRVARWDGTVWSVLGTGLSSASFALTASNEFSRVGPALYVGGSFTEVEDVPTPYLATWTGCADVPTDFDESQRLDLTDHAAFAACLTGPAVRVLEGCAPGDADLNAHVDLFDFAVLADLFTGP